MAIDIEQVRWVSHLARLKMSDAELAEMARQLGAIVEYVDQLKAVDTEGVEPLAHPLNVSNVFRDDELAPCLPVDDSLANAPVRTGDFFGVPAVLE